MKMMYIFLLFWAVFITGLADGISWAFAIIPGVGFLFAFAITCCINMTMGAGLLGVLILNDMYHPQLSPFGIVGALIPGLNFLPFWVGLVIAGIVYKTKKEGGALGQVASMALNLQSVYQSGQNPLAAARGAAAAVRGAQASRQASGPQEDSEEDSEKNSRTRMELRSPNINRDITPPANDNFQPYVQKAA